MVGERLAEFREQLNNNTSPSWQGEVMIKRGKAYRVEVSHYAGGVTCVACPTLPGLGTLQLARKPSATTLTRIYVENGVVVVETETLASRDKRKAAKVVLERIRGSII